MRLRLWNSKALSSSGLVRWWRRLLKPQSTKGLIGLIAGGALVVLAIGGGAYAAIFGGFSGAGQNSTVNLQKGLVGWYKMNGNAKDSSPYRNNGTVTGATLTTDHKATSASAYNFSGSNQYITIPNNTAEKPTTGLSISTWINPTSYATDGQRIISSSEGGGYTLWTLAGTSSAGCTSNSICFDANVGGAYRGLSMPSSLLPAGTWGLVTGTYDGTTFRLYLNGVQQASLAYTGTIAEASSAPICIGSEPGSSCSNGGGDYFNGSIDDMRIYNRAITGAEVTALYNQYDAQLNAASGEKGLVGWWKLDGNANDSSPYRNNATVVGATPTNDRKGAVNSAYSFNGTTNYLSTTTTTNYNSSYLTVSAWAYASSNVAYQTIASRYNATPVNGDWLLGQPTGTTGKFRFGIYAGGSFQDVPSPSGYAAGTWHLVTGTYDGSTVNLYVDGTSVASTAYSGTLSASVDPLYIGARAGSNSYDWNGSLDDVRIYKRALSAQEVSNLYKSYNSQINLNSSPTNGTTNLNNGLMGYWNMNGNANDSTPYRNNGTLTAAPALSTDRKGRANSAYQFNGSTQTINFAVNKLPSARITVSVWAYQTALTNYTHFVNNDYKPAAEGSWDVFTSPTGAIAFGMYHSGTQYSAGCANNSFTSGAWHLVVATYDGTTLRAYVDGIQCGTGTVAGVTLNTTDGVLQIGSHYGNATHYIDDVRVYNRALSTTEITALYNSYY